MLKIDKPILRVLRRIKTKDGTSALTVLIRHLAAEDRTPLEIAALMEISIATVKKALEK